MIISAVVPCYKEQGRILGVLEKFGDIVNHIIVVDDACPENTGKFVKNNCEDPRVEVIEHEKVNCLFSEPQFNPAIIKSIAKDTKIKTGVLDPLGATLDKGKGMYSELLQSMYASFKGC